MKKDLQKGDRFRNHNGIMCFIVYIRGDSIKLSYITSSPYIEPWSRDDFLKEMKENSFIPIEREIVSRVNIVPHLIEYQLNLIGKGLDITEYDALWIEHNSLTQSQFLLFKGYAIPLLKKIFKFNKKKAEDTFNWFCSVYGLKIK